MDPFRIGKGEPLGRSDNSANSGKMRTISKHTEWLGKLGKGAARYAMVRKDMYEPRGIIDLMRTLEEWNIAQVDERGGRLTDGGGGW